MHTMLSIVDSKGIAGMYYIVINLEDACATVENALFVHTLGYMALS